MKKKRKKRQWTPSRRTIVLELEGEIKMYKESYREVDGTVRDKAVLRTIACLEAAIRYVEGVTP